MTEVIVFTVIYLVSAILVAWYYKKDKKEKDASVLVFILTPMFNTILVMFGFVCLLSFCIIWALEHFPLTRWLLRWLNNGKEPKRETLNNWL